MWLKSWIHIGTEWKSNSNICYWGRRSLEQVQHIVKSVPRTENFKPCTDSSNWWFRMSTIIGISGWFRSPNDRERGLPLVALWRNICHLHSHNRWQCPLKSQTVSGLRFIQSHHREHTFCISVWMWKNQHQLCDTRQPPKSAHTGHLWKMYIGSLISLKYFWIELSYYINGNSLGCRIVLTLFFIDAMFPQKLSQLKVVGSSGMAMSMVW